MRDRLSDPRFPRFVHSLEIFTNETDVQINVLEADRPVARSFYEWCESTVALEYPLSFGKFRVSPRSFFQVNRFLIEQLVERAVDGATGEIALDLYAGVGLFARRLAQNFENVTAVEAGSSAARDLEVNAARRRSRLSTAGWKIFWRSSTKTPDFVLADPPRAGLGQQVVAQSEPARRAADDYRFLRSGDAGARSGGTDEYKIERLTLIDLFPQTFHIEAAADLLLCS